MPEAGLAAAAPGTNSRGTGRACGSLYPSSAAFPPGKPGNAQTCAQTPMCSVRSIRIAIIVSVFRPSTRPLHLTTRKSCNRAAVGCARISGPMSQQPGTRWWRLHAFRCRPTGFRGVIV